MAKATGKEVATEEGEEESYLTYTINIYDGGTFNIHIGDHCEVRVMSGQPSTAPVNPPKG